MQKILVDKGENVSEVVGRFMKANDLEVTLVIPRNAAISGDAENFSIIKQQAATEGIEISIESVDDDVLQYAKENDLAAVHPLFARSGGKTLSDIVPNGVAQRSPRMSVAKTSTKSAGKKSAKSADTSEKVVRKISVPSEDESMGSQEESEESPVSSEETPTPYIYDGDGQPRSRRGRKILKWLFLFIVVAGLGAWGVGKVFGRATVNLEFKKAPWEYNGQVTVRIADANTDIAAKSLPGEVFNDHRNMTNLFPASGRADVSEKARGKITIYNNFSSAAQALVATTRFATPEGKVFRLVSNVTVPGAKTQNGSLQPSSIEADIIADQPGDAYNIQPTPKLTIPGFQGTPKYDGFYGTITTALTGGSMGEKPVATAEDFSAAKDRTRELLEASLKTGALRNQPSDFVIVDGASEISITKLAAVSSTAEIDKFGVFGEGDIQAIAFRENDMKELLVTLAEATSSGMILKDLSISYTNATSNFEKGVLTLTVDAKGTLTGDFSEDNVRKDLAGKNVDEAKLSLIQLPNLSHAQISLWPFWIGTVPQKASRIVIQNQ